MTVMTAMRTVIAQINIQSFQLLKAFLFDLNGLL